MTKPTHRPLRLEAAILSRMRSEVTSRLELGSVNELLRDLSERNIRTKPGGSPRV